MRYAQSDNASKVVFHNAADWRIGEASDLQEEWIQRYFDYLSNGTLADGAKLIIDRVPSIIRCRQRSMEFHVDLRTKQGVKCPECIGTSVEYVSGREYQVDSMEIVWNINRKLFSKGP